MFLIHPLLESIEVDSVSAGFTFASPQQQLAVIVVEVSLLLDREVGYAARESVYKLCSPRLGTHRVYAMVMQGVH